MKTKIENFNITSNFTGSKAASWDNTNYNHHTVTIYNRISKKRLTFYFWGSIVNPEIQTETELLDAVESFLLDVNAGMNSFETFCDEFGYDMDSRKAYSTWKNCTKATEKAARVIPFSYGLYEAIQDKLQ